MNTKKVSCASKTNFKWFLENIMLFAMFFRVCEGFGCFCVVGYNLKYVLRCLVGALLKTAKEI
jgi:hypothetical protein